MPDPSLGGAADGAPAYPSSPSASTIDPPSASGTRDDRMGHAADDAPVSSIGTQAMEKLGGAIEGQKSGTADLVDNFATSVRNAGRQFEGQQDWIASAIQRGADEIEAFAAALRERSIGDIVGQGRSFARQQPALFVGASLVLGFAVARLGKVTVRDTRPSGPTPVSEARHAQF